jgi:hypothetical protein
MGQWDCNAASVESIASHLEKRSRGAWKIVQFCSGYFSAVSSARNRESANDLH